MANKINARVDLANKITNLWSGFDDGGPDGTHCPEQAFDLHLNSGYAPPHPFSRIAPQWTALLAQSDPSMDWLYQSVAPSAAFQPFDGTSPEAYGAHVLAKLERWLDDWRAVPRPTVTPYREPPLPRSSRFDAGAVGDASTVANRATTLVLRANEDRVREWLADPADGWDRLHLYADVGGELGVIGTAAVRQPDGDPVMVRDLTGCAVVVRRRRWGMGGSDNLVIGAAYPEVALNDLWRERYPDLVHALAGYYHQSHTAAVTDVSVFVPQRQFMLDTTGPARERVTEQLGQLLAETTDEQLTQALHAFGCYLIPFPDPAAREWLTRWLWRIDGLPWNRRAANSWIDRGGLTLQ